MDKGAPPNGYFFIRFVTFTSKFVYSVVWNQALNLLETPSLCDKPQPIDHINVSGDMDKRSLIIDHPL